MEDHVMRFCQRILLMGSVLACSLLLSPAPRVEACGGFFCQAIPINQAAEQIIFRKDGTTVTAVVLIQYAGDARDFSWVLPVPGVPEFELGSALVFNSLEPATRPVFTLETNGEACPDAFGNDNACDIFDCSSSPSAGAEDDDGVDVLESLSVGPFLIEVVRSDDPEAMTTWLAENEYDLADRGPELIALYVEEGMNFVAMKLQQDQGAGDVQPLILRYDSEVPMIPIRLTAVAADPDMGVLVWLLGESRAVPLNYPHVIPNYTRLDWYNGSFNAYVSYQTLVTDAMNEAGGQGFATDYAGRELDVVGQLTSVQTLQAELGFYENSPDDAEFVAGVFTSFVFPQTKTREIVVRALPGVEPDNEFAVYASPGAMREIFSAEQLAAARTQIADEVRTGIIEPVGRTLAVFDGDPYVTRLYTTLSADEMTVDPIFSLNPDLGDQPLERVARMDIDCGAAGTSWSVTLGAGTGRDGELVIDGTGLPPGFAVPIPVIAQDAFWRTETMSASGAPEVLVQKSFTMAQVSNPDADRGLCGSGICGAGTATAMVGMMVGMRLMRRRK
jgi:hypothetical protein